MEQMLSDNMSTYYHISKPDHPAFTVCLTFTARAAIEKGQQVAIRGFVIDGKVVPDIHHCGIEKVEVTGGQTTDPATAKMYAKLTDTLTRMGFDVVPDANVFNLGSSP